MASTATGNRTQMILNDLDSQAKTLCALTQLTRWSTATIETISRKTDAPIINTACSSTDGGGNVISRDARNLQQQLSLCSGAKAMLAENIWTAKGNWHRC
ncbi:hypothetical protein E4U23_006065 [Claviceps purpurea]|nr:hypothetical protein E4U23_006065 [Claviceps purpurea]